MQGMEYIIGLILGLGGLAWFFKSKNDVLKGLVQNVDFKTDLLKKDEGILTAKVEVKAEETKRAELTEEFNNEKSKDLDLDILKEFFDSKLPK